MAAHEPVMVAEVARLLAAVARRAVRRLHGRPRRPRACAARGRRDARDRPRSRSDALGDRARGARAVRRSRRAGARRLSRAAARPRRSAASTRIDGALADLGVSSMQLDAEGRGFSFRRDEPLDMRMDRTQRPTAADLLRDVDEEELADVIFQFGEERYSRRVARAIVTARRARRLTTTGAAGRDRAARDSAARLSADRSGDADLPGAAHLGQPRARRARRVSRAGGRAPAGRARGWR